ncbi:MAG: hypothetical protein IJ874_03995 [Ruminococcus sp.]|nr:hypothetical protein [Ruminococcus sp.]
MSKLKRSAYTLMLVVTCFICSPFIFAHIWKTSAQKSKPAETVSEAEPETADSAEENTPQDEAPEDTADSSDGTQSEPDPAAEPAQEPVTEAETAPEPYDGYVNAPDGYFSDALFIGDSRMVGIMEYGVIQDAAFFCSVGLSSDNIDDEPINGYTFDDVITGGTFGKVYIMLGVNEAGNDLEYTKTRYRAVVERVKTHQPDAVIYLLANLRIAASAENDIINNSRINALNDSIERLADNKRTFYLDVNPLFDDGTGNLTEDETFDGIHVLAKYYVDWTEWLKKNTVPIDAGEEDR